MGGSWWGKARALAVMALTIVALSSCYIPDKFHAELQLSKYGDYRLVYDGVLAYVPILHDYEEGKIKPEEEASRLDNIKNDLVRDSAVKKIQSLGKGLFSVRYERQGRLGRNQLTAILRRDAALLRMKSNKDNSIIVVASGIKPSDAEMMSRAKIGMTGEFRITTDANVRNHNATEVRQFGQYQVYIWKIENALSPMPRLIMIRDIDPERPLPDK